MKLRFDVEDNKKIRVIIDTDAACEADDPFAIAHALMSPKLIVRGITAEHFVNEGSVNRSYEEIKTVLNAMDITDIGVYLGEKGPMTDGSSYESEAVDFIIEEAFRQDEHPLYILCLGAITNVACAMRKCPEISDKINIIWIGTHGSEVEQVPYKEFNAGNDIVAANIVMASGVNLSLVPSTVYSTITIGIAEIQDRIATCGKIGKHLFENMIEYNQTKEAWWTAGESWSLGDSPAVAIAVNPGCGHFKEVKAPYINEDTSSTKSAGDHTIKEYTDIDSRYILEDLIAKLRINYA